MKSPFQRIAALALCFTLTLGAFAYRPSEAKAIAGVDDAVVIGALLSAFAGGCGLIFSNNGMTSGQIADGMAAKWDEFNRSAYGGAQTFAGWLGFEDTSALLGALSFSGSKLVIPRAIARKLADFTTWLANSLASSGVIVSGSRFVDDLVQRAIERGRLSEVSDYSDYVGFYLMTCPDSVPNPPYYLACLENLTSVVYVTKTGKVNDVYVDISSYGAGYYVVGRGYRWFGYDDDMKMLNGVYESLGNGGYRFICNDAERISIASESVIPVFTGTKSTDTAIPDLAGEKDTPVDITGVGDGTATTIEGLLQQILAQLQANTLAPTLDLAGTESGGNTGTDEDAKPYLPYIPQIFEKIKELPGTLANIWESIKGIPAAIAEKIGAFFTTLWGWLQSIIDAITALPAAIAEKIGALFKPDEALLTEITDNFKGKFGFFSTLKQFGSDLFGMTPETEPPVIWVHLENAESKFGYNYGDKQKIFDMTWYQKYKASVDGLLSGFLWLGYLWLLFKRAPAILGGMQLSADDAPRSADMPDVLSSPRLGAGDGSTMFRGDGFTMRDKGGRSK